MSLETFTGKITDLVVTNPTPSDPRSQGDDHLRGIKFTLAQTFPGFNGPLTAARVPFEPFGNIAAANVQAALQEVDAEKLPIGGPATLVAFTPSGNIAATNVQAAIQELDNEKASLSGATFTGNMTAVIGGHQSFSVQQDVCAFGNIFANKYWAARSDGHLEGTSGSVFLNPAGGSDSFSVGFSAPGYSNAGAIYGTHVGGNWVGTTIMAGNGQQFFTFRNNGVGYAAGGWQNGSDERLKDNITLIPEALAKLTSMRGCTFYRNDLKKEMAGIIAQDLQAVLPQGVSVFESEQQLLSVDPMAVIALLVEATKELTTKVADLEARLK